MAAKSPPLPFMPVWISEELQATNTMSVAQFGARTRLLYNAWSKGPLLNDSPALARMVGVGAEEFNKLVAPILEAEFFLGKDGWINKAVEIERAKSIEYRTRAAERTARGGDSTKSKWEADPEGMAATLAAKKAAALAAKKAASVQQTTHEPRLVEGPSSLDSPSDKSQNIYEEGDASADVAKKPPLSDAEWRDLRDAFPKQPAHKAQHQNKDWGEARRYASQLVLDNRATWHSLLISTRNFANYCASIRREPMSVVVFFGSAKEYWLRDWASAHAATAEKNEHAQH